MSSNLEQAVVNIRAIVMSHDGQRWLPAGDSNTQQKISKVQLFQHAQTGAYRVVGRNLESHEVVLNCALFASMKYDQTEPLFHRWRSVERKWYALNFVSVDDAQTFAQGVSRAMELLNAAVGISSSAGSSQPGVQAPSSSQNAASRAQYDHHHNGVLPGVASAPALLKNPQVNNHYQPQASSGGTGDFVHHQRMSQDEMHHQLSQQQQYTEAYYGVSPALHLQHQRRSSAGSNGSSSGSSGPSLNQTSNLIYSTVTPATGALMPSPSRPPPPVPPPPPPPVPATANGSIIRPPPPPPLVNAKSMVGNIPPAPPLPPSADFKSAQKQPSLAQALTNAKLRKVPTNGSGNGTNGCGRVLDERANVSKDARSASIGSVDSTMTTTTRSNSGHPDMMSEMAATLARRRMMAESGGNSAPSTNGGGESTNDSTTKSGDKNNSTGEPKQQRPWEVRNGGSRPSLSDLTSANTESPKTHRKAPSGSSLSSQEDGGLSMVGGNSNVAGNSLPHRSLSNGPTAAPCLISAETLEQWKQEIMIDVRKEINKAKAEIIDALKAELNRR